MIFALHSCNNKQNQQKMENTVPKISDFPVGEENAAYAQYFSGKSWNAPLTSNKELNVPMNNITFEPGCRNNWHLHTGGQILICVGGIGYYQERGKKARRLNPGDIVEIAPNIEHWHGAAPDSWFSHIGVACNPKTNENKWLEPVTDDQYKQAVNESSK
ncbi:4-carboxymuconolactone decarboxylase [Elizabethkingia miricola]|nr:4-carboxymuconolactone decarboxylase [Elizabethkingia miricola]